MHKKVAIVAHSTRFPGTNFNSLWTDLLEKKDLITEVDSRRWDKESFLHPDIKHPGTSYTFAAGSIGDISLFDADFFGISPREAACIDPQQRLLLELAWETFENAGIVPSTIRGSDCGVFIGISSVDYASCLTEDLAVVDSFTGTGSISSIAANRLSYFFDLHGPSMAIDTACSSALVAFHQACQAIRTGEISQALAGGINLHAHPFGFISFSKATMLSKTGRCHVFDEAGDGYVRSEGGGLFLIKDYDQAIADGDPILAVVSGSAVNTDGNKSGLTIPSPEAQARLMSKVYQQAKIDPDEIDYLEAHGTGTAIGDPIETRAISQALGQKREKPLLIGSIKSNLGHLESASGVAGLAKAINCIQHRTIPATIGINKANTNIPLKEWNLQVVTDTQALKNKGKLTVGVNSFGFGGSNAHVILQSSQDSLINTRYSKLDRAIPLVVSAKNPAGLTQAALELSNFLENNNDHSFYDIAHTAFFRREQHQQSTLVFSYCAEDAATKLKDFVEQQSLEETEFYSGIHHAHAQGPAFVYSGNGCQWLGMGKQLLTQSSIFNHTITKIDKLFNQYASYSLKEVLNNFEDIDLYKNTEIAQPALFALQVGITEILRDNGIHPIAVVGHSVGEVAAAWASGALSLDEAVKVIYYRSFYQGKTRGQGQMTAVSLNQESVEQIFSELDLDELCVAGINSHKGVTIAGPVKQLLILEAELSQDNIFYKRLDLDYAFHSKAMDSIESGLCADLNQLSTLPCVIPYYSTVSGNKIIGKELTAEYWWFNIRKPVLFHQTISAIINSGINTFIEIGAHPVLTYYLKETLTESNTDGIVIPTVVRDNDTIVQVMSSVGKTIISGVEFDHELWFPVKGNPVKMPNYPWQREQFWHRVTAESHKLLNRKKIHPLLGYEIPQHALIWENQLDTKTQPYLTDHNVGGSIVFPGAGYIEMAIAAAHQLSNDEFIEIEEIEIQSPLLLSEEHSKVIRFSTDSDDKRFSIKSRDHTSSQNWSQHVVGRILEKNTGSKLSIEPPKIPTSPPDFTLTSHTLLTECTGLAYGANFKTIEYGWSDKSSALGVFKIPESISATLDQYFLHPSLLDCTFQLVFQILKDNIQGHQGIAFIPVKVGRIHLRTNLGIPHIAKAKLLKHSPHSLKVEFSIFDTNGQTIAVINDVRFRAVKLHRPQVQLLQYLDYHLTAMPLALSSEWASSTNLDIFYEIINKAKNGPVFRRYSEEIDPLLETLCLQFISETLSKICDDKGIISNSFVTEQSKTSALISHIISIAEENGILETFEDNGWQLLQNSSVLEISATDIWNTLVQDYPDYFYLIHLVGRVGIHLNNLIKNDISASDMGIDPTLYAKITRHIHEQTSKSVLAEGFISLCKAITESLSAEGERLNILEIGDNNAYFANLICPQINFNQCNYKFLGLNDEAVNSAKLLRDRFPLFESAHIDSVTADTPLANFAIINLDFVDLQALQQLLAHMPTLLVPGSKVFFIGLQPAGWIDTILGTSQTWWLKQENNRFLSPQLKADWVVNQLTTLGFTTPKTIEFSPNSFSGIYLIETNVEYNRPVQTIPLENWLILSTPDKEKETLATFIASRLEKNGQNVILKNSYDEITLEEELFYAKEHSKTYNHIIHLSNIEKDEAEIQTERCLLAAKIIQACEFTQTNATCWLLTRNVGSTISCDSKNKSTAIHSSSNIAHDSALWGFGRTLMNEASNYKIKLVDYCSNKVSNTILNTLVTELLHGDDEQEIFINSSGKRFTPRLRIEELPGNKSHDLSVKANKAMRLNFDFPGQLRFLQWQEFSTAKPADDEIEVEVKATGLNFRDIMYTLGLLSDEAVENGFVGPSLGLEFAGIITKTGKEVTNFSPGNHVVGFAPASFSNRILTKTSAITHIPEGMSFSAAATIPSTFFTVYYALHYQARLQKGEKILIHGAAGGVGIAAIQIARWLGAEIYATVGSEEKRDFLKLTGITHIHNSRTLDFAEEILQRTDNKGVDVVLNSLSGEAINRNLQVLKPFGRFLELGKRDFYENTRIGLRPFRNNISYFGIDADQMMKERPDLTRQLFTEMMQLFQKGILNPLPYTSFDSNQVVDAFRYMQQAKQIGKIVVTYDNTIYSKPTHIQPAKQILKLKKDASYLVTGGLNGFGLRTAEWLVEKGARHLILISRSGPTSEYTKQILDSFQSKGINVLASSCDVSDKGAVKKLLDQTATTMPPLKGVIHSAAVIDDGLVRNLEYEQIDRVLKPKILGAKHLHELTLENNLDIFVLYSSATTLFGNPGQGNYVAANMWLEALASHRRQQGLAATCVRWGAIEDVGFLARNEKIKEALKNRMGGAALPSSSALNELEQLIMCNSSSLGVLDFEWRALNKFLPTANSAKFREIALRNSESDDNDDDYSDIEQLLKELSGDELKNAFISILKKELSQILLISEDKIDPSSSMYDFGLDSLMGVELIVAIESRFNVQIPMMSLTESPTLDKLTNRLISQLLGSDVEESAESSLHSQITELTARHGVVTDNSQISELADEIQSNTSTEKIIN